ncbi:phage tail sheath subtilisin-like domain-containing protein [Salmonella enterica]|nr:phage tail sheath subtilisin-like domain-containing protein [Salmonella enterica]
MSVFFNGQLLTTPQTASAVNDDAMLNQNLSVGNVLAVLGESLGGKPFEVLRFGNPNKAREVLVGGELCDAVISAFAPSSETGSPQTVLAVRVNPALQSQLQLMAATPGVGLYGTLKGNTYSSKDTQISVKVEATGSGASRDITLKGGAGAGAWSIKGTGIGGTRLVLAVHSADSTLDIHFDADGVLKAKVVIDGGSATPYTEEFPFDNFPTLGELTDYLESLLDHSGVQVFVFDYQYPDADRALPSDILDPVSFLPTAAGHTPVNQLATWRGYAVKNWFDTYAADYVTFELNKANSTVWSAGLEVGDYKALVAQPSQVPTVADWADALALLERQDVQWIHAVTGNPAIHAQVKSHVEVCSNVMRRERRTILGTVLNTSDTDAVAQAKSLNSPRVSLVHIGYYTYDGAGKLVLRPAYMTAGLVAAGFAGVNPGTPLTNKSLSVQGLERDLANPTDTDVLIKGGVLPIENTETGYKITQSITTWLGDSKYSKREQSCGVAIDFAIRNVRQALDVLRGQKQTPILLARAVSIAKGTLTELSRPEPMGPEVLVGDENSPAWRNVSATVEGDVLRVQFEASPAIPNNYILVTMYAVPYSGSATA